MLWQNDLKKKNVLRDVFEEVSEDMALSRAIESGEKTDFVSREENFSLFES